MLGLTEIGGIFDKGYSIVCDVDSLVVFVYRVFMLFNLLVHWVFMLFSLLVCDR